MQALNLYRYRGENGTVDTTVLLPMEHENMYRLIADVGMTLTDGEGVTDVIDIPVAELEKWSEIKAPEKIEDGEAV